ncbi:hypothetical protein I871_02080 [Borrelia miyamotoi LB-2001]|nr:hypothetical protein I871_02080 [Borrelia miyamotoi LB-2001]
MIIPYNRFLQYICRKIHIYLTTISWQKLGKNLLCQKLRLKHSHKNVINNPPSTNFKKKLGIYFANVNRLLISYVILKISPNLTSPHKLQKTKLSFMTQNRQKHIDMNQILILKADKTKKIIEILTTKKPLYITRFTKYNSRHYTHLRKHKFKGEFMKTLLKLIMILSLVNPSFATKIDPSALNKILNEKQNQNKFGIGFGMGNPITNIIINFPYVEIDLGYGGFNGLNPNNFTPYIVFGTDILFKEEVYQHTIITGGLGLGIDLSQIKTNEQYAANLQSENSIDKQEEFSLVSTNNRLGTILRIPITLEYYFLNNVVIGFKAIATIGCTMTFKPTSMEGIRFGFFGFGFIKAYI